MVFGREAESGDGGHVRNRKGAFKRARRNVVDVHAAVVPSCTKERLLQQRELQGADALLLFSTVIIQCRQSCCTCAETLSTSGATGGVEEMADSTSHTTTVPAVLPDASCESSLLNAMHVAADPA